MLDPSTDAFIDLLVCRDPPAWGAFYDAHVRQVYAFVNHLLEGDRGSTDDVTQDVWLQAMACIEKVDPKKGELRAWLFGIARRRVSLHFRRRLASATLPLREDGDAIVPTDNELLLPEEIMERLERKRLVQAALMIIPDIHRHVLTQKYVHGHSVNEIAVAMELTAKAVESLLWGGG